MRTVQVSEEDAKFLDDYFPAFVVTAQGKKPVLCLHKEMAEAAKKDLEKEGVFAVVLPCRISNAKV